MGVCVKKVHYWFFVYKKIGIMSVFIRNLINSYITPIVGKISEYLKTTDLEKIQAKLLELLADLSALLAKFLKIR